MKKLTLISVLGGLGLMLAHGSVSARSYGDYAQVISAQPVYRQVAVQRPYQACHMETVAYRPQRSHTGTIAGGVIGAAVGSEIGRSRGNSDLGAVAGGLLGASIGRDISRNRQGARSVVYQDRQVCQTRYRTEHQRELLGYDVIYRYNGQRYQTRMPHHPGDRIRVNVNVQPVYR